MAVDVLLGLQWGDEGKGKIVDLLAPNYDVVARFQGGPNAGHTLEFDGIKHVLHQIPSGIFRENIKNYIGNGVIIDPIVFSEELRKLRDLGLSNLNNLFLSNKAHIIIPSHKMLDAAYEKEKGKAKIGSTLRGIGPTYQDKIARTGLRIGDVVSENFKSKYEALRSWHLKILDSLDFDHSELSAREEKFFESVEELKTLNIINGEYFIEDQIRSGNNILAEGAQGSHLDIDFGTYPFVTSSNTTVAGACTGLGVAPKHIKDVFGVFKAYCTRVGSGPFPTELFGEEGEELRKAGNEFGATTGRPRRCGWLDLPSLRHSVFLNGVTKLYITKSDILDELGTINVCTDYDLKDGKRTNQVPYDMEDIASMNLKAFNGWNETLLANNTYDALPETFRNYINFIENYLETPIAMVSLGPGRNQNIEKETILA